MKLGYPTDLVDWVEKSEEDDLELGRQSVPTLNSNRGLLTADNAANKQAP